MRNMLELTRNEQRVVIFILVFLVVAAFTEHLLETKSEPAPKRSTSSPAAAPTIRPEQEQTDADDSR